MSGICDLTHILFFSGRNLCIFAQLYKKYTFEGFEKLVLSHFYYLVDIPYFKMLHLTNRNLYVPFYSISIKKYFLQVHIKRHSLEVLQYTWNKTWEYQYLSVTSALDDGDRWTPGTCWPGSLTKWQASGTMRDCVSKIPKWRMESSRGNDDLSLPYLHGPANTHCAGTCIGTNPHSLS